MADRYAAFISYANRYASWVRILQRNLERCLYAAGLPGKVFLDQTDLKSGRSWVTQLQAGIDRSKHFILVATPEALASPRVVDEWESFVAKRREWSTMGRFHVVDLLEVPLPPFPDLIRRVDFRDAGEAKYRQALRELVAGLRWDFDERILPALTAEVDIPLPPDPGLDPALRSRLVSWLTPVLSSRLRRRAIAPELHLPPEQLEGQASWECAASSLLVWATGDEEPLAAAIRIIDTLYETFEEDEPALVAKLVPLREELLRLRFEAPERGLLATWMEQVVRDHQQLVPYFQQQAEIGLLDRVYVELELRAEQEQSLYAEGYFSSDANRLGRQLELAEVLALPRKGWISGRWVVLGDPGAGKTTLLRHLAAVLARQADRKWVPLFESLPRLLREREWLLDRVVRRLERAGHPAQGLAAVLDRAGKDGRLLLLLDGLDEVPREEKEDIERLLCDLAVRWPTTPIVVASRPIGYRPLGSDYRTLRLLPLDRAGRREFLARWLGRGGDGRNEESADAADAALEAPELRDLAGNPLYLTLMALLFEQGAEPSRNRPRLYDQVFDLLLAGKHRSEGEPMEAQAAVRGLLRHIAVGMTEDNLDAERVEKIEERLYRPETDAVRDRIERVPRWRSRLRRFLDDLSERTGILGPHDGPDTDWRFWHRTFREALTAEYLEAEYRAKGGEIEVLARVGRIITEESLSAWAEPFALLVGRLEAPDDLVKDLVATNRSLGLRAVATAQTLRTETLGEVVGLDETWWKLRSEIYPRIPEMVRDPSRALKLLDRLRRRTTNGNDLFFIDRAVREVGRRSPNHALEAETLIARLYDHIPPPEEDLFLWIDTPKDGRVFLWREIPAGETWIGSPAGSGKSEEKPRHRVTIERSYAVAVVTVTNAQFRAFDQFGRMREGESRSVFDVTWYEAVSFCRWLANCFPWAWGARLPLEEEWEYACRAGSNTSYWSGEKERDLARVGWYDKNWERRTHRVGEKEKNPWGLYDVHGNVWEWTLSQWTNDYEGHRDGATIDPAGVNFKEITRQAQSGEERVLRGGSAWFGADWARAAFRGHSLPGFGGGDQGFRIALPALPEHCDDRG
ncbi:MAG TPA: SUMF1/EgtB/PvdO family nonheme iron enzyme [Thermoanaerobaculia bacterium]|jgi:formylglycine-generating enzyme required for sulfatase activity|nr:SUMF1/EgtB/PvdO family nonheme iron enzyme [Thermoanaerobaculia bacterium]